MAKQQTKAGAKRKLIQLIRNVGEARYGQTYRLTDEQIAEHGFKEGDYKVIEHPRTEQSGAGTPTDNDRSINDTDVAKR